ncbi:uncharacterized protein F5147DRAFT_713950 [Suillus discolor]|uniref:Uncharacterized protein n=1 Tax=Suillus discolor TaxID=1912936 RepID=A0A9P7JQL3_9AGAM|nr:uncharacterized protein F5147DRAFT_713950 [Suillus discolor]KAG2098430.1 hypothetical protein F5147DRAFT_713950 [Suillus discolor]
MSSGSPTAYLVWSVLACLFFCFLIFHLWEYDRFQCLKWSESGRQPGAFKRFMSYTYIATLTFLVMFNVAYTFIKFKEGFVITPDGTIYPKPIELYSTTHKKWILPLLFLFSAAWACEIITHWEELTFWLFILHQGPKIRRWFDSWEFRVWLLGTVVAGLGMPLTTLISRRELDTCQAWIFLVGSSASTATTILFLYVLARFPAFIRRVKADGGEPKIVLRLVMFYQLNFGRVLFRFLFTIPLFILALDGVQGSHSINESPFWSDFLILLGGIGCFVSSFMTLLIFFPRSLTQELGYTTALIPSTVVDKTVSADINYGADNQHISSPMHTPKAIVHPPSVHSSEHSQSEDTTPEYEFEDSANNTRHYSHSHDGHMRIRQPWEQTQDIETDGQYMFDRHSGCLVRPHSDGIAMGLHPYVRTFRSPIDICDLEDDDHSLVQ